MQRASAMVGRPIVTADSGEKLGTVADVLVDIPRGRVAGFVVGHGLLAGERVLPFEAVSVVGPDAIVSRSAGAELSADAWRGRGTGAERSSRLRDRRVLTASGREVGAVSDLYIDEGSGALDALEVSTAHLAGLVHRHARLPYSSDLTIGSDAVIVPENLAAAMNDGPHAGAIENRDGDEHRG